MLVQMHNKIEVEWYTAKTCNQRFRLFSHVVLAPRKSRNATQKSTKLPSPNRANTVPSKFPGSSKMAPKDTEMNYDPTKSKYHPIDDACWSREDK